MTEASGTRACGQGEVGAGGLRGAREKGEDRGRGSYSGSQEVPEHLFVYISYELTIFWFCFCYFGFPVLIRRSQKDVRRGRLIFIEHINRHIRHFIFSFKSHHGCGRVRAFFPFCG